MAHLAVRVVGSPCDPSANDLDAMLACMDLESAAGAQQHEATLGPARVGAAAPAGVQPLCTLGGDDQHRVVALLDGFLEERDALASTLDVAAGADSDTQLVLHAYLRWGLDFPRHITGSFSIVLVDAERQEVILVRDRFGTRPLYHATDGPLFCAASRVEALHAAGIRRDFDAVASIAWVLSGWTRDDHTLFGRAVRRVPAGGMVCRGWNGSSATTIWYEPRPDWASAQDLGDDTGRWLAALDARLSASVAAAVGHGTEVGILLSGGVDSSLIAALAARLGAPLRAFTLCLPGQPEDDETPWARAVAQHCGLPFHPVVMTPQDFQREFVRAVRWHEQPFVVQNTVAVLFLARAMRREGIDGVLSGEGADACFGGNMVRSVALRRLELARSPLLQPLVRGARRGLVQLGRRVGMGAPAAGELPAPGVHEALVGGLQDVAWFEKGWQLYDRVGDALDRELAAELFRQLHANVPALVHRLDAMLRGLGLGIRLPFLDHRLVELALALPARHKLAVRGFRTETKPLLKQLTARYVPHRVVYRPKMGFQTPSRYFHLEWPRAWLADGFLVRQFGMSPAALQQWFERVTTRRAGPGDPSGHMMLGLETWGQLFVAGRSEADVTDEFLRAQDTGRQAAAAPARSGDARARENDAAAADVGVGEA